MAKIIKCPKCGDNVEIPANFSGQLLTCVGCGTGLKIRNRKAGATTRAGTGTGAGAGSGGSMSGSSMSSTIIDDSTDPPAFGTECANCGRQVNDPSDLIEDRGQLVCSSCLRRPKAATAGAAGGMPEPRLDDRVHHGKLVTVDATFLIATLMAAVVLGAQAWLHFNPKPIGTRDPNAGPVETVAGGTAWEQENAPEVARRFDEAVTAWSQARSPDERSEALKKYDSLLAFVEGREITSPAGTKLLATARSQQKELAGQVKADEEVAAAAPPPAPAPTGPVEVATAVPSEPIEPSAPRPLLPEEPTTPSDPEPAMPAEPKPDAGIFNDDELSKPQALTAIDRGYAALAAKEWRTALNELIDLVPPAGRQPNAEQLAAIRGMAAAYLGAGDFASAVRLSVRAYRADPTDRATIVNYAMAQLARQPDNPSLQRILDDLKKLLSRSDGPPDEAAYNVYGTALTLVTERPGVNSAMLQDYKAALDAYTARLNATRAGERRWGVEWKDAEYVELAENSDKLRADLLKRLEEEEAKAFRRLEAARTRPGGSGSSEEQKAQEDWEAKRAALTEARNQNPKPWLTKFEPVIPDRNAVPPPAAP